MRIRLIALIVAVFALAPAYAHAAGGPWAPNIRTVAIVNDSTWLATTSTPVNLSRTTDGGRTWSVAVGYGATAPDAPFEVSSVAVSGGIAYAVGAWNPGAEASGGYRGALSFGTSTDGGVTWSWRKVDQSISAQMLVADPGNPARLALFGVMTSGGASPTSASPITLVSEDRGVTWRQGSPPPALIPYPQVGGDGTLYSGTSRSTDWGASWLPIATVDSSGAPFTPQGALVPYGASGVAAITATGELMTSANRGDSWTRNATGISAGAVFPTLAGGPGGQFILMAGSTTYVLASDGSTVAQFSGVDLQSSSQAWVAGGEVVVPTNGGVIAVSSAGMENRSTGIVSYGVADRLAIAPNNTNVMLASTDVGLYRSADGGNGWTYAGKIVGATFNVRNGLAGGVRGSAMALSADSGSTWNTGAAIAGEPLGALLWAGDTRAYMAMTAGPDSCVLGRFDGQLASVTTVPLPAPCGFSPSIATSADNPDLVFFVGSAGFGATGATIYRSTDAGTTWTTVKSPSAARRSSSGSVVIGSGAKPAVVFFTSTTSCSSTNLGQSWSCAEIPNFELVMGSTKMVAQIRTLDFQADGALVATIGQPASSVVQIVKETLVLRSVDNGRTWATTGNVAEFTPVDAVDITGGKAARQGSKKKSAAGTRRFALSSVGIIKRSLRFALSAEPAIRTAGIKVARVGGGKVTIPLVCMKKHRCSGRLSGSMRVNGRNISLTNARFSILGSKNIVVRVAKKSQKAFKATRGAGTIKLRVRYDNPSSQERKRGTLNVNAPVTVR